MDSLTQATLGAAIGHAMLSNKIGYKGAVIGGFVATIPDLDVLLFPFVDSLERISVHRGLSHSIIFAILVALILTLIMSRVKWTREISQTKLWLFNFLALFTHDLLDAFTTYGTQLFLPFSDRRVSLDSINIVDPVYTLPLLIGLMVALFYNWKKKDGHIYNYLGLGISTLYLLVTLGIKQHINQSFQKELAEQNINYQKLLTVPVGIASLNWYGVARSADSLYIGKMSDLSHEHILFEAFPVNDQLLSGLDEHLVNRLKWFAQGFYTVAENDGHIRVYNMQCDMQGVRYYGDYKAPTAFYYEITPLPDGSYDLNVGMHMEE